MTTALDEQKILVKDLDGHWYSIPRYLEESFIIMREAIQLADWGSSEWYDANDDLNDMFAEYMKGDK